MQQQRGKHPSGEFGDDDMACVGRLSIAAGGHGVAIKSQRLEAQRSARQRLGGLGGSCPPPDPSDPQPNSPDAEDEDHVEEIEVVVDVDAGRAFDVDADGDSEQVEGYEREKTDA